LNRFEFFATIERYHTFQNPTSEEKLDLSIDYCAIRDGMQVLDIGCGKGWLARRIAKRFDVRVTGLEINPTFAAESRRIRKFAKTGRHFTTNLGLSLEDHAGALPSDRRPYRGLR
jgi:cyclopropane fatty-acyl-phospholipid synthase-like methyltransferase